MRKVIVKAPNNARFDTTLWRESVAFPDDPLALACDEIDRLRKRARWWKHRYEAMQRSRGIWRRRAGEYAYHAGLYRKQLAYRRRSA